MSRVMLATGARGEIVRSAQNALTEGGFDTGGLDGSYGAKTVRAVRGFRSAHGLPAGDAIDVPTWRRLTGRPVPRVRERALQLTAAFEGHGFTLAEGNYDGAGITWGVIGFTLRHGELTAIVLAAHERDPQLVTNAFGARTKELLRMLRAPWSEQETWANSISRGPQGQQLAAAWATAFRRFGELPAVQALQLARVDRRYFSPARQTARDLGLSTELGLALCFDAHVQNGSVKASARAEIERERATNPPKRERDLRVIIANAVANASNPRWAEDVRSRKLTIATGSGTVHGGTYSLKSWGLGPVTMKI